MLNKLQIWVKNHPRHVGTIILWLIVLIGGNVYLQANNISPLELGNNLHETLTGAWYGALLYVLIYLLRPLFLFPASVFTLLAGTLFGLIPGFLIAMVAGVLSSLVPYSIGRWFGDEEKLRQYTEGGSRIQQFVGMMTKRPFQAVLTMRLLYLPYDAVSFVAGNLHLSIVKFLLATTIGNLGGTLLYVSIGASLEGDLTQGSLSLNPSLLALSAALLVIQPLISWGISKYRNQGEAETEQVTDIDTGKFSIATGD
ncbi:MAG: TVP38/TMEM64 family protein [Aggregatilineales bacterium]